jgi:hypothetical protein
MVDNALTVMVTGLATIRFAPRFYSDTYPFNRSGSGLAAVPASFLFVPLFSFSWCFSHDRGRQTSAEAEQFLTVLLDTIFPLVLGVLTASGTAGSAHRRGR